MSSELAIGIVLGASVKAGFSSVFGRTKNTIKELGSEIQRVKSQQDKLGLSISKGLASGKRGLGDMRRHYDMMGQSIQKAAYAQKKLNDAINKQERAKEFRAGLRSEMIDTAAHGAVVAGPVIASVKKYMEQESASADLKIAMMRKDGSFGRFDEIDRLTTKWGADLPGNKKDFTQMALGLKSQGISDDTIINGGGLATAQLNTVIGIPIADGSFFAKNMEAHGIKEADLLKSADLTQRAYFAAGLKKEDMFEAMKYYSGKANNIGFTGLEHQKKIYGIEGLAATKGIEGSQFGTNFSTFLGNLSKGVENLEYAGRGRKGELRKMMQSAGANFDFFNADGSIKDLRQITGILESEFGKIRAKYGDKGVMDISNAIFGSEGGRIADILIQSGVKGFDEMLAKMDAQASLQERIQVKTGTLSAALEALGGTAENTAAVFGGVFAAEIQQFAQKAQAFVENTLQPWLKENKGLIKWVVGLAAGFFAGKLAILGLMYAASMALMPVRALATGFFKAQAAFRLFQLMRLGKIGRGVMLLRMFGLSAKNAASSARFFSSVWKIGSSIIGSVIRNVLKLGSTFLQFGSNVIGFVVRQMLMLGRAFLRLGVMLLTTPIGIALTLLGVAAYMLYKNWDGVVGGAKALWQDLSNFIGGVVNSIASFFGTCWESIKAFFNSGIGNISAQIINWSPLGLFYQSFASVMSWFGVQLPSSFTQFGANIIQGLWNGLQSKFESVKAWFAEKAASLKQTFAGVMGIHSPSRVFRRFGGWMMDGLQIGLDGSAARPIASIANTAGRLKSGFTDHMGALAARLSAGGEAFASARNTQAVGGMTINYNPTINAPGGNPQQIEAALQMGLREFEAMFRRMMDDKARRAY